MKLRCFLKKWYVLGAALSLALALSGCMFAVSPDDLFALPKLPEEYVDLETEIDGLLESGYDYAALTEGGCTYTGLPLTIDGNIVTGEALGAAIPFALALARLLGSAADSDRVKKAIVYQ